MICEVFKKNWIKEYPGDVKLSLKLSSCFEILNFLVYPLSDIVMNLYVMFLNWKYNCNLILEILNILLPNISNHLYVMFLNWKCNCNTLFEILNIFLPNISNEKYQKALTVFMR